LSEKLLANFLPSSGYGEDIFTLKLDHLRDRLTLTLPTGSSLNRNVMKAGEVMADWSNGNAHEASQWDDLYLPWSHRRLIVPFLDKTYFFHQEQKDSTFPFHREHIHEHIDPHSSMQGMNSIKRPKNKNKYDFVEFQAWGPISSNDLESFTFTKNRPNRNTLKLLAQHQISTFDGTSGTRKFYQTTLFDRGSDGKCHQMKFVIDRIISVAEDVEPNWCDFDVGNVIFDSSVGEIAEIIEFEIDGRTAALRVQALGSKNLRKVTLNGHIQKPTLQQVITFANLDSDKVRIRNIAAGKGFVSSPQALIDLYSNIGSTNFSDATIEWFFNQKPTLEQVIALANIESDKFRIRDIAAPNFASSPKALVKLYSDLIPKR
ncbi:MAG: hypothetical protein ABIQ95_02680, partial [Bdellovibrionia bacterium]